MNILIYRLSYLTFLLCFSLRAQAVINETLERPQVYASKNKIEKFLEKNKCTLKVFKKSEKGDRQYLYSRSLNREISKTRDSKWHDFLKAKTAIEEMWDEDYGRVFLSNPINDRFHGEEISILFRFPQKSSPGELKINNVKWGKINRIVGVDFNFTLKEADRKYQFRCDS